MPSGIVRVDWLSAKTTLTGVGSCSYELEKPGIAPRLFQFSVLRPIRAIQRAILNRLGDMLGLDVRRVFDVGDSAGDFQDAVVGAGTESLLSHGALEQSFTVSREFAEGAYVPR